MKLDRVGRVALNDFLGCQEDAEGLEDRHGTAAIVVGARRGKDGGKPEVDGVLVRADDDRVLGLAGNRRDDRVLAPRVLEVLGLDPVLVGARVLDRLLHRLEQPLGRLPSVVRLVVARVEARELLEMRLHLVLREVSE